MARPSTSLKNYFRVPHPSGFCLGGDFRHKLSAPSDQCNYVYDDLARVYTVNCQNTARQNVWNQIFGYDAFGNITKTVPVNGTGTQFLPTYSTNTNRFTSIPGVLVTYDADGNLLGDNEFGRKIAAHAPQPGEEG